MGCKKGSLANAGGEIGARRIVNEHLKMNYLQVDMCDDVNAVGGSETGEYSEKIDAHQR